mmetsp:Transcript_2941/g.6817  ORF Transcript_2941/g.6817 Transcript_2941/m.6817 type:complete len:310 (-) Transcript_2941:139-1068(-)
MASAPYRTQRVMSIQSHVVSGYVGNKAATFPLQLLGFDVDVVNSVHFSNHTGYPDGFEGDVLGGEQLRKILEGLNRNGLLQGIDHLLTGYIGSESFLRAVLEVLKTLRSSNEGCRYVCDPVLGDNGKFYCPPELVDIYREEVIPLANVVTPNQFEVEQLTGVKVRNISDARRACDALHNLGPDLVFITSIIFDRETVVSVNGDTAMTILASSRRKGNDGGDEIWRIDSPVINGTYTGTGDLCSALLLAWTAKESEGLASAMEKVCGSMWTIIKETEAQVLDSVASQELRLIQSKGIIEDPPILYKARRI